MSWEPWLRGDPIVSRRVFNEQCVRGSVDDVLEKHLDSSVNGCGLAADLPAVTIDELLLYEGSTEGD